MLTTDLGDPGYGWNRSLPTTSASRSIRQLWSALDGRNLATDQMLRRCIYDPGPCPRIEDSRQAALSDVDEPKLDAYPRQPGK
jgi:hypothetical protein